MSLNGPSGPVAPELYEECKSGNLRGTNAPDLFTEGLLAASPPIVTSFSAPHHLPTSYSNSCWFTYSLPSTQMAWAHPPGPFGPAWPGVYFSNARNVIEPLLNTLQTPPPVRLPAKGAPL